MLHRLDVQTQYLSHENLASYYIHTPDPRLDNPTLGQRLFIQWSLPASEFEGQDLTLYIKVRLRNHQERKETVPICKCHGTYFYQVLNQDYFDTGGIMTYLIEIRNGESVIECWRHPLWTELINFEGVENP